MIALLSYLGFQNLFLLFVLGVALTAYYYNYVLKKTVTNLQKEPSNTTKEPIQEDAPQLVKKLSFHHKLLNDLDFDLDKKDSLTDHLDLLSTQLAEKESKLHISKSRILETEFEMESLKATTNDVCAKYQDIMINLKKDLQNNESECKRLQKEIEWVSRKRGELRDEVRQGHQLYGKAASDLTMNLTELQRGRVIDKPTTQTVLTLRHHPYPLHKITPVGSVRSVVASVPGSPESSLSRVLPLY